MTLNKFKIMKGRVSANNLVAKSVGAVEYTDCFSAKG